MTENAAEKIRLVPMTALVTTDWNVRTTQADRTAMAELKASILAHQLISPLAVRIGDRSDGTLEVIAGRRRHQALRELYDEKQIPADYEVPCRVLDEKADETEVALAENVCRVAMDPLDQSVTFTALVAAGASIEGISTRFGISTRTVEQRLRLTTIAPEIIAAYKDGGLKLTALNAFGNTTDHERQLQVWKRLREGYQVTPDSINRYLRDEQVAATSSRAKYLGLDAFTAAGGHIETNLFGDDEATYLIEVDLLDSLVKDKLQAKANSLAKRWKWAEARVEFDYHAEAKMGRIEPVESDPTDEERETLTKLSTEMDAITAKIDAKIANKEDHRELREQWHDVSKELHALQRKIGRRNYYTDKQRAIAGCHVALGHDGHADITYGLVRPEDVPKPEPKKPRASAPAEDTPTPTDDAARPTADVAEEPLVVMGRNGQPYGTGGTAEQRQKTVLEKAGINQALSDDLRHVRVAIVKGHLANDPDAALDLLLYTQYSRRTTGSMYGYTEPSLDVSFTKTQNVPMGRHGPAEAEFQAESPGIQKLADRAELPLNWMKERSPQARYEALRALSPEHKRQLMANLVAESLKPRLTLDVNGAAEYEATVERLGIDFASEMRPTKKLFWNRITKGNALEIAATVLGKAWAETHAGKKKGEIAELLEQAFSANGTHDMTAKQKAAAAAWTLPGFNPPQRKKPTEKGRQTKRRPPATQGAQGNTKSGNGTTAAGEPPAAAVEETTEVPAFLKTVPEARETPPAA